MLELLISCWYDCVVVACRYMFTMGSDVVLVLLLLYCVCRHMSLHFYDGFRCCVSSPPTVLCLQTHVVTFLRWVPMLC